MDLFTHTYVTQILNPFIGKNLRMDRESTDKTFSVPFILETSMDSGFQIDLNQLGISFILKDNFYTKRDLNQVLTKSFNNSKIYVHMLDNFLSDEEKNKNKDNVIYSEILSYIQSNFNPQIAFTYYTMIDTLEVGINHFIINGIKFTIKKH